MKIYKNLFDKIIAPENLFAAWDEFKRGKGKKLDVQRFEKDLEQNIFALHRELKNHTYKHSPYTSFYINDPKRRHIHKATVRDRILHHAIFSVINPIFESSFIGNSFSCRIGKGTHKGVQVLAEMLRQVSHNGTRSCFALKFDIRQFFASVNHLVLKRLIARRIKDEKTVWLCSEIIEGFAEQLQERERERVKEACRLAI